MVILAVAFLLLVYLNSQAGIGTSGNAKHLQLIKPGEQSLDARLVLDGYTVQKGHTSQEVEARCELLCVEQGNLKLTDGRCTQFQGLVKRLEVRSIIERVHEICTIGLSNELVHTRQYLGGCFADRNASMDVGMIRENIPWVGK